MKPTNELRFVEREEANYRTRTIDTVRILQQKWKRVRYQGEVDEFTEEEWRDVPVEKEQQG